MRCLVRFFFAVVLVALLSVPAPPSSAAVIERDFVPGSGDGLLTYDGVNQREWLDVTIFSGAWSSFDEFEVVWRMPGYDITQLFPELAPGGIYEDFTLATRDDVLALAESGGIDTTTHNYETNNVAVDNMINALGVTRNSPMFPNIRDAFGFTNDFDTYNGQQFRLISRFKHKVPTTPGFGQAGVVVTHYGFPDEDSIGLMLYRDAIPEPKSLFLVGVCSCIVLLYRMARISHAAFISTP